MNKRSISRAERYLWKIGKIDGLIRRYSDMAEEQRETIIRVSSPALDPQRTSGGAQDPDKFGRAIAKLEELETMLNRYIAQLAEKKAEALALIWQMKNYDHQNILIGRYLQMKSPEEICGDFDKECRWYYRHRLQALEELGDLIE